MKRTREAVVLERFVVLVSEKETGPFRFEGFFDRDEVEKALETWMDNGHLVFNDPTKFGYRIVEPKEVVVARVVEHLMETEEEEEADDQ